MAGCGIIRNIRRKICRHLYIRFTLLGVPLLWLMFIWWAMYYTQSIETFQSKRELPLSIAHQNHMKTFINVNREEAAPRKLSKVLFTQMENVSHDAFLLHVLKPPKLENVENEHQQKRLSTRYINSTQHVPDVNEAGNKNGENHTVKTSWDNQQRGAHYQGHKDTLGMPRTIETDASYRILLAKVSDKTEHPSSLVGGDYVEFVWKGNKPKPVKKFITPGVRFDPPNLGEFGKPVTIKLGDLSPEQLRKYDDGWQNYKFNEYASQLISTQRQVPDYRPDECKVAHDISHLPKASVIICFYNEAWSVLLRTIHSVLTMSPPELISEIILVDDHSDFVMMHEPLEYYVAQVDKLRLLRMTRRSGLVRARLAGVREAKGSVLIFLDSHIECEEDWLPPLLQTIVDHPNYAVTPEIDVIDNKDLSIHAAVDNVGIIAFDGFTFDWASVMPRIKHTIKSPAEPFISPAMAGGLFAIRKDYFLSVGTYDASLELWGGENIELSLKLWMCGGGILIHPCSKVAHIFRDDSPYLVGKSANVLVKNSARVAQVWADEYRDLYFRGKPYNEAKYGSVREQQELRKKLKCQSFSWYLDNVFPEMHIPNTGRLLGQIKSMNGLCVHSVVTTSETFLELNQCKDARSWESTRMKEIRSLDMCMDKHLGTRYLVVKRCNLEAKLQMFVYLPNKSIYHQASNTCVTGSIFGTLLTLERCRNDSLQTWIWPENTKFTPLPMPE